MKLVKEIEKDFFCLCTSVEQRKKFLAPNRNRTSDFRISRSDALPNPKLQKLTVERTRSTLIEYQFTTYAISIHIGFSDVDIPCPSITNTKDVACSSFTGSIEHKQGMLMVL